MRTHKQVIKKVKRGHCPFFPACGRDDLALSMARDWENVDCKACLALKPKSKRRKDTSA